MGNIFRKNTSLEKQKKEAQRTVDKLDVSINRITELQEQLQESRKALEELLVEAEELDKELLMS